MSRRVPAAVTRRRTLRGAAVLGLTNGVVVGLATEGYVAAYPDEADRAVVASTIGGNPGLAALFGEPRALETIAGFTEWRVLGVLPLVGAVWALLVGTAALRGEEDAGRWDVVLTGPLSRRQGTAWGLVGLGQSLLVLTATTLVSTVALGVRTLGVAGPLWTAATLVVVPAVLMGVAAATSQLASTRAQAAAGAAGVLGVAYVLRVVATATGTPGLHWATPLGWADRAAPLTDPDPRPLLVGLAAAVLLAATSVVLAGRRDVGAGLAPERARPRSRTALLLGPTGLAVRLDLPTARGWLVGVPLLAVVLGLVAPTASDALADATLDGGLTDLTTAEGTVAFLGAAFLVVGLLLSTLAAGQAAAARQEEASGRLETLLAAPVGRLRWLGGRVAVAALLLLLTGLVAGLAAWWGTALGGEDVDVLEVVGGGLNAVPAAWVTLAVGVATLGWWPRATAVAAYGYVAAAFLLEVLGSVLDAPEALLWLSVFHHVPLVPAEPVDPAVWGWLTTAALVLSAAGAWRFRRRDVTGP